MTNLLKFIHVIAVLALGVGAVTTVTLFLLLCAQWMGIAPYAVTSLWDLIVAMTITVTSFWYLRYIGDPDLLSAYIKAKLRINEDNSEKDDHG